MLFKFSVWIEKENFEQVEPWLPISKNSFELTELSCKSGIYSERGPKGPDF